MIKIFLVSIFFLVMPLQAKTPANHFTQAQELWKDFRACQSLVSSELQLINCVDGLIAPQITRYEKGKLTSFLVMGFSFSDLHDCNGIKDLLPLRPVKGEEYFCMSVLGNTTKRPGFITVTADKGRLKLAAIKYND